MPRLVDVGVNLTHREFRDNWRDVVRRSIDAGVDRLVVTGVDLETSRQSLHMAQTWFQETGTRNLLMTVGIHPCDVNVFDETSIQQIKELVQENTDSRSLCF